MLIVGSSLEEYLKLREGYDPENEVFFCVGCDKKCRFYPWKATVPAVCRTGRSVRGYIGYEPDVIYEPGELTFEKWDAVTNRPR